MDKRTSWTLYIVISLIFSLAYLIIYMNWRKGQEEEAKKARLLSDLQASFNRIGAVELEPKHMNYGRLNGILQEQGKVSSFQVYENAVTVEWYGGIVKATFLNKGSPSDTDEPLQLELSSSSYPIAVNFQGSVRGVRLGYSEEQATTSMRRFGCSISTINEYGSTYADCKDDWRMHLRLSNGKIEAVSIKDKQYWIMR